MKQIGAIFKPPSRKRAVYGLIFSFKIHGIAVARGDAGISHTRSTEAPEIFNIPLTYTGTDWTGYVEVEPDVFRSCLLRQGQQVILLPALHPEMGMVFVKPASETEPWSSGVPIPLEALTEDSQATV